MELLLENIFSVLPLVAVLLAGIFLYINRQKSIEKISMDAIVVSVTRKSVYDENGFLVKDKYDVVLEYGVSRKRVVVEDSSFLYNPGEKVKFYFVGNKPIITTLSQNCLLNYHFVHFDVMNILIASCIFLCLFPILSYCSENEQYAIIPTICIPGFLFVLTCFIQKGVFVRKPIQSTNTTKLNGKVVVIRKIKNRKKSHYIYIYLPLIEYEWLGHRYFWNSKYPCNPDRSLIGSSCLLEVDSFTGIPVEKTRGKGSQIIFKCVKALWIFVLIYSLYQYYFLLR